MTDIKSLQSKIQKALGKKEAITENISALEKEISIKEKKFNSVIDAQIFLQKVAQETQEGIKVYIQDIVSLALDACFPDTYEFCIDFEIKRGQTEANIYLKRDEEAVEILEECGGGVADLVSFALRISMWTLSGSRNTILLDEPFRFVSKDLQPKACAILKQLSEKLNLQFIVVTHNREIMEISDKIFEAQQIDSISEIKEKAGV